MDFGSSDCFSEHKTECYVAVHKETKTNEEFEDLKKRYLKLEEKRNALRQAVKLLEAQTNKLQAENLALTKDCEEERKRADLAHQVKEKESGIKSILEKEIHDLKSEIASLQENANFQGQDRNQLLETRVLQGEVEIKKLNELLQREINKGESEKRKVVEEKKKAAGAWKQVKIEKSKAEEEKRIADMERKKADDLRHSLLKSKSEASEAREKLIEERLKAEAANSKVELEKQKASREKKRADSERAKTQKELLEKERKKLTGERNRADCLSQQLEEERQKREELQKKMDEIEHTGQRLKSCLMNYKTKQVSGSNEDAQPADVKFLKSKLKLLKDQLKHAKRLAKLEKAEKRFILQQLCLLRQDHIQFSHRLETIINSSSYGVEGTDGLAKVGESLKQHTKKCATRAQRKCDCAEHDFNPQIESKTNFTTMECVGPIRPCTWLLPHKCGGRSTKPISGTSSDLESPVGDSVRDKSQNSAICSTAVTSSDTQLMGSQGKSTFAVTTSAKLVKDNFRSSLSRTTGEETKVLHVAQQNNDESVFNRKMEFPCMNSVVCNGIDVVLHGSQCNMGKRKAHVILDTEDCNQCLKINNNNSVLEGINSKSFIPSLCRSDDIYNLNGGKNLATELCDDSDTTNTRFHSEKMSTKRQKLDLQPQPSGHIGNCNKVYGHEVDGREKTCFVSEALPSYTDALGHAVTCRKKSSDIVMNDREASVSLENTIPEDYMKLLDLDDDAEEERYRAAIERPLSPTLPELESPGRRQSKDDYHSITCGVLEDRCATEKEKHGLTIESRGLNHHSKSSSQVHLDSSLIPEKVNSGDTSEKISTASLLKSNSECCRLPLDRFPHVNSSSETVAVVNPTNHALRKCQVSNLDLTTLIKQKGGKPCSQGDSEHMNFDNIHEKKVIMGKEKDLSIGKGAPQTDTPSMRTGNANCMSLSKANELKCLNVADGLEHYGLHGCCIVFSNTKDEKVISRIICARNSIIHDMSSGGKAGFSVAMAFHALAANVELSAKEKACILFSLLLCKVTAMIPVDCGTYLSSESEFVVQEMAKVISDEETRSMFLATCLLDIFVTIVQDFLTARKVIICEDTSCEQDLHTSDIVHYLDNERRSWTLRTAAINQLVAGSVILASISTVHGRADILWQTSFQLLWTCRDNSYWILTALHVFASICGRKFFSPTGHNLAVTAIKSLVLLLERGKQSSHIISNENKNLRFSVCVECPFAEGEVCLDKVTLLLLEALQNCIAYATRHPDYDDPTISYNTLPSCISQACGCDADNAQFDDSSKECSVFCSLHNFVHKVDRDVDIGFCHFTDIVSLLELCGYYMGWECLHGKIIQQLFTLLESCPSSAFSVSLLVLIGRLGRIGIEAGGPSLKDIEGLMCNLATFMDVGRGKNSPLLQFSAVDALLHLFPLDFRETVEGPLDISLVTSQVAHVEHIRRWFRQLSEEQKAVSLRLFQNSDVKKS